MPSHKSCTYNLIRLLGYFQPKTFALGPILEIDGHFLNLEFYYI